MAKLKLFWTETAISQHNFIFEYWIDKNKSDLFSKRTEQLKENPTLGKITEFAGTRLVSL